MALQRVGTCQKVVDEERARHAAVAVPDFTGLAEDLETAWKAPGTTMRTRQRLVRALVENIVADVDEAAREVVLVIHWKGGQHSSVRVRKPKSGETECVTSGEAIDIIRSMAGRWSDGHIAASLNRMGLRTGRNNTWNAKRVNAARHIHGIDGCFSVDKSGEWCTMLEAAKELGVSRHTIGRLLSDQTLPAHQVVPRAPYQIRRSDLQSARLKLHWGARELRAARIPKTNSQCFQIFSKDAHNDTPLGRGETTRPVGSCHAARGHCRRVPTPSRAGVCRSRRANP